MGGRNAGFINPAYPSFIHGFQFYERNRQGLHRHPLLLRQSESAGIEPARVAQPQALKFDAVFPVDNDGFLLTRVHEDEPVVRPDPGFQQRLKILAVQQIRVVPQDGTQVIMGGMPAVGTSLHPALDIQRTVMRHVNIGRHPERMRIGRRDVAPGAQPQMNDAFLIPHASISPVQCVKAGCAPPRDVNPARPAESHQAESVGIMLGS